LRIGWREALTSPAMMLAWAGLLLGLLTTFMGWQSVREDEMNSAKVRFQLRTEQLLHAIQTRMDAYEQVLRDGAGLFHASSGVSRREWAVFFAAAEVQQHFPGIQGFGFARLIPAVERETIIAEVRAEGFPDFDIHPAGEREMYTTILYLEPFDWRNRRAFGYDMYSEPVRHAAMEQARLTGKPAMSGKVKLIQETETAPQAGFLMYVPVYRPMAAPEISDERRRELFGWVYAPFRADNLMADILGTDMRNLRAEIFDSPDLNPASLMHDSIRSGSESFPAHTSLLVQVEKLTIAGHDWHIRMSSLPAFEAMTDWTKLRIVSIGGVIGSVLLFAVLAALIRNRLQMSAVNDHLRRSLIQRETLLRELHHRVKNNLQGLWGLLQVERSQMTDPAVRHRLDEIGQRINIMGNVHQQLYRSGNLSRVELSDYLNRLCQDLSAIQGRSTTAEQIPVHVMAEPVTCGLDTAIPLGLIANELISNALKHAFPDGRTCSIQVSLRRRPSADVELSVIDDGVGMTGRDQNRGGIGMMLIHSLAGQIEATVEFSGPPGCTARITIPGRYFDAN
jgi:two-component sensor histidine kinase/CHASE1-domain containing sensor protein